MNSEIFIERKARKLELRGFLHSMFGAGSFLSSFFAKSYNLYFFPFTTSSVLVSRRKQDDACMIVQFKLSKKTHCISFT